MSKTSLKRKVLAVALAAMCAMSAFAIAGCGSSDEEATEEETTTEEEATTEEEEEEEEATEASVEGTINVYSREEGSGTRDAFTELMGILDENDVDNTTDSAVVTNSTAVMLTSVAGDTNGIGYVSLGSLDDTVAAVAVDGVEATAENVSTGDYTISRPFNVVLPAEVSAEAQDFLNYILSAEGQAIVEEEGYVAVVDGAESYTADESASGSITVAGSSSVTPVMEKLAEAYEEANGAVEVSVQQSDSSTGVQNAIDGVCDLGMASRDLKDTESSEGVTQETIAMDGIAVIVNLDAGITDLTSDQIMQIFTGEVTDWSEVL